MISLCPVGAWRTWPILILLMAGCAGGGQGTGPLPTAEPTFAPFDLAQYDETDWLGAVLNISSAGTVAYFVIPTPTRGAVFQLEIEPSLSPKTHLSSFGVLAFDQRGNQPKLIGMLSWPDAMESGSGYQAADAIPRFANRTHQMRAFVATDHVFEAHDPIGILLFAKNATGFRLDLGLRLATKPSQLAYPGLDEESNTFRKYRATHTPMEIEAKGVFQGFDERMLLTTGVPLTDEHINVWTNEFGYVDDAPAENLHQVRLTLNAPEPGWGIFVYTFPLDVPQLDVGIDLHGTSFRGKAIANGETQDAALFGTEPLKGTPSLVAAGGGVQSTKIELNLTQVTKHPYQFAYYFSTSAPLISWFGAEPLSCWGLSAGGDVDYPSSSGAFVDWNPFCDHPFFKWYVQVASGW